MSKSPEELADERGGIIAFRAPAGLMTSVEAAAAAELISRSDVVRRALVRDLERTGFAPRQRTRGLPHEHRRLPSAIKSIIRRSAQRDISGNWVRSANATPSLQLAF